MSGVEFGMVQKSHWIMGDESIHVTKDGKQVGRLFKAANGPWHAVTANGSYRIHKTMEDAKAWMLRVLTR